MALVNCSKGHLYDTDLCGDTCPYCSQGSTVIEFGDGSEDRRGDPMEGLGKSMPVSTIAPETITKTKPTVDYIQQQEQITKTEPVFTPAQGTDPVVGWLVCVSGHDVGTDYRLFPRTNTIGRGANMDVRIKGDTTITSDTHAKIDYDALNNNFYLLTGNNRSTIYLNSAPVYEAVRLSAYDRIRLGKTEVLFVPFCSDRFVWPSEDDK